MFALEVMFESLQEGSFFVFLLDLGAQRRVDLFS